MNKKKFVLNKEDTIEKNLLKQIANIDEFPQGAFNLRKNGVGVKRTTTENIDIVPKKDKPGIDIYIKEDTKNETVYIPVIITESGLTDLVYNDFYIGKNADVTIVAGCGIHNTSNHTSQHDGIHAFHLEENSKVKYVEKHYGSGDGNGKRVLNPKTIVNLGKNSYLEMETYQIKGVDSTVRETVGDLKENSNLVIFEKVMTHGDQFAKSSFDISLDGENASTHVVSRAVAKNDSYQEFISNVNGNSKCYGHVECDAIIMDNAKISAIPKIEANNTDARLIHEAAIGKIAGEQLIKLMTLGLSEKQAENEIINGFLK